MPDGNQNSQSASYSKLFLVRFTDNEDHSLDHLPIFAEDLVKLGVESRFIPFVVSETQWAEQSPNGSPPPSTAEAESVVEILDKVRPIRERLNPRLVLIHLATNSCHPTQRIQA